MLHGGESGGCAEGQTNLCPYHPAAPDPLPHQKWVEELLTLGAGQKTPDWTRMRWSSFHFLPCSSPTASRTWYLPGTVSRAYLGGQFLGSAEELGYPKGKPPWFLSHRRNPVGKPHKSQKESGSLGKTKKPPCSLKRWEIKGVAESRVELAGTLWSGSIPDHDRHGPETLGLLRGLTEA